MSPPLRTIETSPKPPAAPTSSSSAAASSASSPPTTWPSAALSVALVEKGRIGAEQSSRNWGWCRQQNRDARELPMATKSLDLWEQFAAETGEDTGFHRCGLLYLSDDEAEIAALGQLARFREDRRRDDPHAERPRGRRAGQATGRAWKGGVFSPTDGTADPAKAAPAVAAALMKLGGSVHQNCAARGIELEGGRVSGVITEAGVIRTRTAVLAGGAWASSFCRQLGIRFPQASIRQSILRVSPVEHRLPDALYTAGVPSRAATTAATHWPSAAARAWT